MTIQVQCGRCRHSLGIDEKYAGRQVRCPKCSTPFTVPSIQAAPPADDPFSFGGDAPAATGGGYDFNALDGPAAGPAAELPSELRDGWRGTGKGLVGVWLGTILQGLSLGALLFAAITVVIFGTGYNKIVDVLAEKVELEQAKIKHKDDADYEAPADPLLTGLKAPPFVTKNIIYISLGVTASIFVLGSLLRLIGFMRCLVVPEGSGTTMLALLALLFEIVAVVGVGMAGTAPFLMERKEELALQLGFWGDVSAFAGGWFGLLFTLMFLAQVSSALDSKDLQARLRKFSKWFFIGMLVFVLAAGAFVGVVLYAWKDGKPEGFFEYVALGTFGYLLAMIFTILPFWLTRYLGLLGQARDDIRRVVRSRTA